MAKILICEDHEVVAQNLADSIKHFGYVPHILAKQNNPQYVIDHIESLVETEQPDYVLIDGLGGKCNEVADLIKKINPDILPIIFSASLSVVNYAKQIGYVAFTKSDFRDGLMAFIKGREEIKAD